MTDAPDPNLGRVVAGKYRIDSVIGTGAVGTVYRATHMQLKREVALKVLRQSLAQDATAVARFAREAQLASQLDHPNIVRVFDHGTESDGMSYLVMELLEGKDLADVLAERPGLPPEEVVHLVAQVLAALAAAHRAGVVHRDLKPANIVLVDKIDDDGRSTQMVKVADFGIAKAFGATAAPGQTVTTFGTVSGTPEYMSPEQANGDELDGRSDLYACGILLYEMLAGEPPFTGDTPLEVLEKHFRAKATLPSMRRPVADRRLERVAMHALEKDRNARYPDAPSMRTALIEALAKPPEAPPASPDPSVVLTFGGDEEKPKPATSSTSDPSVVVTIDSSGTPSVPDAHAATVLASKVEPKGRQRRGAGSVLAVTVVLLATAGGVVLVYARSHRVPPRDASTETAPSPVVRPIPSAAEATAQEDGATTDAGAQVHRAARRPAPRPAPRHPQTSHTTRPQGAH